MTQVDKQIKGSRDSRESSGSRDSSGQRTEGCKAIRNRSLKVVAGTAVEGTVKLRPLRYRHNLRRGSYAKVLLNF